MYQLESETTGDFERGLKDHAPTDRRRAETTGSEAQKRPCIQFGKPFSR
jgi:hypothetical protein